MKIAIVQDGLMCRAGGEQVALSFHNAFPKAPIFTLAYDSKNTFEEFKSAKVITSWLQKISNKDSVVKKIFFPLGILAALCLDVRNYDIILMSTTHCAKYIRTSPRAIIFCYSHNPFRLVWYPQEYHQFSKSKGIKKFLFRQLIKYLSRIDKKSIERVDFLITNSENVKSRLALIYDNYKGEAIKVIYPPVSTEKFFISQKKGNYFLIVSRLESYKKVDLAVEAFNILNLPLIIVGKGECEQELKQKANSNITFLKDLNNNQLAEIYSKARAFLFPQLEDFGITAVEANASGIPVIAYGYGGILETQIDYNQANGNSPTALFFKHQEVDSLYLAVKRFLEVESNFNPSLIREHAKQFAEEKFIEKIRYLIHQKTHSI